MATAVTDSIFLVINGKHVLVQNPDPTVYLADFLRNSLGLKGTKIMCREGGCGACKVMISKEDPSHNPHSMKTVNSCLIPLMSLDGWYITTIEKVGSDRDGLSKIQTNMIENFGMQCGYCTPGMIMTGLSCLLKSQDQMAKDPRTLFDGNICRCTGYRPIMDAMKCTAAGFSLRDIEDICQVKNGRRGNGRLEVDLKANRRPCSRWLQPENITELLNILQHTESSKVRIIAGNTSLGIYKKISDADFIMNLQNVGEMKHIEEADERIYFGAAITLTEMIITLKKHPSMLPIAKHIQKIGNEAVRNVGTWAGNLMMLHSHRDFPSDLFLLLALANAVVTVVDINGNSQRCDCWEFLKIEMDKKVLTSVEMDIFLPQECIRTYKIMPRHQNSYAYVNAAFRADVDTQTMTFKKRPILLFGALAHEPVRAVRTETFLQTLKESNECLESNTALQACLKLLEEEIHPLHTIVGPSVTYRKQVALNLFYKFYLSLLEGKVSKENRSAVQDSVDSVPFSEQSYPTQELKYPMTQPVHRMDSDLLVSGKTEYTNDIRVFEGEVFAAFVLAGAAPATFTGLDTAKAESMPGFIDIFTYKDVPGSNKVCMHLYDHSIDPVLSDGDILYAGQPVAVVLADSQVHADQIADQVKVILKDKGRPVLSITEAIEQELFCPEVVRPVIIGDTAGAIPRCDRVIVGQVETSSMHHFYIEPQTCIVVPHEKEYEVYSSTQYASGVQRGVAEVLGVQSHKVFVTNPKCGGAFGGKITPSVQVGALTAVAAYHVERPVRVACNYDTTMKMCGNRAPYLAKYKVGVDKDGRLQAIEVDIFVDAGFADKNVDIRRTISFISDAYFCPNWIVNIKECKTNKTANTHMRSPGSSQSKFIIESIMEHVASCVGESPEVVREKNLYKSGQVLEPLQPESVESGRLENTWNDIVAKSDFIQRKADVEKFNKEHRWRKRGISLLPMLYRYGYCNMYFTASMSILYADASVVVYHGGTEMGQGMNTRMCQLAAKCLDIPLEMVSVSSTSTRTACNASKSGGSIASEQVGIAVMRCCETLLERLKPIRDEYPNLSWHELIGVCYKRLVNLTVNDLCADRENNRHRYNSYGAVCSEAEVDILTGETYLIRTDLLYDGGESINPAIDIGQLEGAFVMGIGQFLQEKLVHNPETGEQETSGTWTYHPPLAKDIPNDFRVHLQRNSVNTKNPLGSKGVGEPAVGMATSCLFAAQNAIATARYDVGNKDYAILDAPATIDHLQQLTLWKREDLKI